MRDAASGRYTFVVAKEADKKSVSRAVETAFKVKVTKVRTLIVKGKTRRTGRNRKEVKTASFKKAIVHLVTGQKIDIFDVGAGVPQ